MTIRRELLPPIRWDHWHQHPSHAKVTHERDIAERYARGALGRYKFVMFGYWCGN